MNLRLVIDGIVRQTTVLIAQLSTTSGQRSPLAHIADQVFFELAREIEAQGVRRPVVADMFGLALRSYQKKMQRLTESATDRNRTLWEAVLELVEKEQPTRARVMERFHADGEREVGSVLGDLVRSGLVFTTGAGDGALYGLASDAVRERIQRQQDLESLSNLAWVKVFRGDATRREELLRLLPLNEELVHEAIDDLIALGRLTESNGKLVATNFVLALGSEQGWEAAIVDHFRAVAVALATKVRSGARGSARSDEIGGSTFTFTVTADHPFENEIRGLLRAKRLELQALWDRVAEHNKQHPPIADAARVTFYLGQVVEQYEDEEEGGTAAAKDE